MKKSTFQRGQSLVEYTLIVALISIAIIASISALGGNIKSVFTKTSESLALTTNDEATEKSKKLFFLFNVKDKEVDLNVSVEKDNQTKSLFGYKVDDGEQMIRDLTDTDFKMSEENMAVKVEYDIDNDTLTSYYNNNKMSEKKNFSTYVKNTYKEVESLFNAGVSYVVNLF